MTKLVLAFLLLLAAFAPARAQTICQTFGTQVICTDTNTATTASCIQMGSSIFCS